jgi:putative ABC transport system permease protein
MSGVKQVCARLIALFRREALDREFDEEARSHLDLAVEDYMRRGTPEAEARRLARIKFGAVEASKDAHRDSRGLAWLDGIFTDLRFALRGLRRDRAFAVTAVTVLALAIGLNVTVFAVMNTMLFRGYPLVKRNDRLVYMQERYPSGLGSITYLDFEDWRSQAHAFEGMAFIGEKVVTFRDRGGERPVDTFTFMISVNAFGLLGVRPMLGRDFVPADEAPGAPPVAMLSYRFWTLRFANRPDIVGHTVQIDNAPATVIGVMPEGFAFPTQENLWMPLAHTAALQQRSPMQFMAFGRLADGATVASARLELETINQRLAVSYPATNRDVVPRVSTYSPGGPNASTVYGSLWAAAWFVVLIASANLANLMVARTLGRSREFSTRIALGAGHWRMVRQMLIESLLLAGAGGALGWWIATWSVRTWATATESRYQVLDYTVDNGTLAYLIAISIGAALLCAVVPIVRLLRLDLTGMLKGDARGASQGRRGKSLSAALVSGQMALAIVLLSGAGILVRSLRNVVNAETGVSDPAHVMVASVSLPYDKYPNPETRLGYFDRLTAQLRTLPGVEDAAVATILPVSGVNQRTFEIEGKPSSPDRAESVQFLTAGSDYFRVLGASAISGREFNDGDLTAAPHVAIVNQSFAARFWPTEQPLGQHLRATGRNASSEWRTVVGVVPNIMQGDATREHFKPLVYVPFRQQPASRAFLLLRMSVPVDRVARAVRTEVQRLDPDVVLDDVTTLKASFAFDRDRMDPEHEEMGKYATVAPIFAGMALILAVVGLYAVIAHAVSQRTKEIGVRIALGAASRDIRRLIFQEGMRPVALGLIVGLTVSLAVNRILQSQLVRVSPYDPVTLATAPAVLILVALLACQIPTRRALRVDPAVALRHD